MTDRPTATPQRTASTIRLERLTRELERAHQEADQAVHAPQDNVRRPADGFRRYLAALDRTRILHLTVRAMEVDNAPSPWTSATLHVLARELDDARHEETARATHPETHPIQPPSSSLHRYLAANTRAKAIRRLIRAIERNTAPAASTTAPDGSTEAHIDDTAPDGEDHPRDTSSPDAPITQTTAAQRD